MECKAITNNGTVCSRIAESGSKYCWQHKNYETKNKYFEDTPLLQNTLLTYFNTAEPLKNINKKFQNLEYEKYNTYYQPHGIIETYYPETKTIQKRETYKNGKRDGLYEKWWENGQLFRRTFYKNGEENGLYQQWYDNGQLWIQGEFKNDKREGVWKEWFENGQLELLEKWENGLLEGLQESFDNNGLSVDISWYDNGVFKYSY
jgi:antitoxin component YwqK of YwqJK toxin-antitoxin module